MKKVLVTGGMGFIGKHTLMPLLKHGYEVHVATSTPSPPRSGGEGRGEEVIFHHANLLNCDTHHCLIQQIHPTHLLHAAWYTENGKFWDAIENVAWLKSSISLFETFYNEGGYRVLGLGTCAEYNWTNGICLEGETPEVPASLYGKIKKATFDCLNAIATSHGKSFAWGRIFFPYGPGESEKRLIPYVITQLLQGKIAACTHGNQLRDFLHVSDIGHALVKILDTDISGAINIGSGMPTKISEVVTSIASALERNDLIAFGAIPEPTHSPPMILANVDRLKNEVAWTPALSFEEALKNTIAWWRVKKSKNGES